MAKIYKAIAPSNIALIKYWGKSDVKKQWPSADSLSMTLSSSTTTTDVMLTTAENDQVLLNGSTEGTEKAKKHLNFLREICGFNKKLLVKSGNNFPTSCGIASSASGMSALTLSSLAAWTESNSFKELQEKGFNKERIANLSRLGSGSAGRSLWGGYVYWGKGDSPETQSLKQVYKKDAFELVDLIVVLSEEKKSVGSTEAHNAAWHSPLFKPRLAELPKRLRETKIAIKNQNMTRLGEIIEAEAIEMHAVMMTGKPQVYYWQQQTEDFISWLRKARETKGIKAWFTIDAGPNVHVLCKKEEKQKTLNAIREQYKDIQIIEDEVGNGPTLVVEA